MNRKEQGEWYVTTDGTGDLEIHGPDDGGNLVRMRLTADDAKALARDIGMALEFLGPSI